MAKPLPSFWGKNWHSNHLALGKKLWPKILSRVEQQDFWSQEPCNPAFLVTETTSIVEYSDRCMAQAMLSVGPWPTLSTRSSKRRHESPSPHSPSPRAAPIQQAARCSRRSGGQLEHLRADPMSSRSRGGSYLSVRPPPPVRVSVRATQPAATESETPEAPLGADGSMDHDEPCMSFQPLSS